MIVLKEKGTLAKTELETKQISEREIQASEQA